MKRQQFITPRPRDWDGGSDLKRQFESTEPTAHKTPSHFSLRDDQEVVRILSSDFFGSDRKSASEHQTAINFEQVKSEVNESVDHVVKRSVLTDYSIKKALTLPTNTSFKKKQCVTRYSKKPEINTEYHSPIESTIPLIDESSSRVSSLISDRPSTYVRVIRPHSNTVTVIKSRYRKHHPLYQHPVKMTLKLSDKPEISVTTYQADDLFSRSVYLNASLGHSHHQGTDSNLAYSKFIDDALGTLAPFDVANSSEQADSQYNLSDHLKSSSRMELSDPFKRNKNEDAILIENLEEPISFRIAQSQNQSLDPTPKYHLNTITEESSALMSQMNESSGANRGTHEAHSLEDNHKSGSSEENIEAFEKRLNFADSKHLNPSCLSLDGPQCSFSSPRTIDLLRPQGRFLKSFACLTKDNEILRPLFSNHAEIKTVSDICQITDYEMIHHQESHDLSIRHLSGNNEELKGQPMIEERTLNFKGNMKQPRIYVKDHKHTRMGLWINCSDSLILVDKETSHCTEIRKFWGPQKSSGFGFHVVSCENFSKIAGLGYFINQLSLYLALLEANTGEWIYSKKPIQDIIPEGSRI